MTAILAFKTIHIIGFVAWFAGLFYLVRMFVYHTEAFDDEEPKQSILRERYALMEDRVYRIICTPSLVITWIAGMSIIYLYGLEWLKVNYWLHAKLVLLILLTIYHFYCKTIYLKLRKRKTAFSSFQFRVFNELPTLFLITIVILAVFKNMTNAVYAILIVILLGILFYIFAKAYQRIRIDESN